jgi:hypothetical protein
MAEIKTKPTKVNVAEFLEKIPNEERRQDCKTLLKLMKKVTGEKPVLWGPSIVGFGTYHYKYASGHEGDMCIAGFANRKDLTVYILRDFPGYEALMKKLGKHKMGVSCLYMKKLADVDLDVLETLIRRSVESCASKHTRLDKRAR